MVTSQVIQSKAVFLKDACLGLYLTGTHKENPQADRHKMDSAFWQSPLPIPN